MRRPSGRLFLMNKRKYINEKNSCFISQTKNIFSFSKNVDI